MNYSTIPTVVGAAKLRNASLLGQTVDITRVAFGDGDGAEYEPTGQETALKKQVYECPPNRIEEEAGAPSWIELEAVIPHNVGGWYLREVGCFDDEGDLIFIGNLPSSFKPSGEAGVIKDLVFEMVYDAVAADVVQIKIDPNVVVATRKYVDDQDKAHTDAQDPHPQYLPKVGASLPFAPILKFSGVSRSVLDLRNVYDDATWSYINLACGVDTDGGEGTAHLAYAAKKIAEVPAHSVHMRLRGLSTQMYWSYDRVQALVPFYDSSGELVANQQQMAQLPLYPEILTDDKKFVMSLSGTTVTVADNQVIRMRGWKDANTSNLTRTFTIVLDKTYHLRLSIDKGLYISLVDDVTYNPDGLPETDKKFDSTYDDALIAKIESGVITPLINTSETFNLTYDGMPNSADSQATGNDWIGAFELPLNWSRTPVSDSVEQKGQLAVLGNHAWTDHMVMTVLAMREDARLCPLGFDKTYRLNRYECRLPVAHAHGGNHYNMTPPVPYLQSFEKIVRVYGY